jgi:hypothetical protein
MADPVQTRPPLTLGAVNIACADPQRLAAFWAAATGGSISGTQGDSVYVTPAPGGIAFFLQRLEGARPDSSVIHLDLTAAPGFRESEVVRLTGLGAVRQWDVIGEVSWVDWTTMADPEGNLFCVAEHPAAA